MRYRPPDILMNQFTQGDHSKVIGIWEYGCQWGAVQERERWLRWLEEAAPILYNGAPQPPGFPAKSYESVGPQRPETNSGESKEVPTP